ncbi:hypothetical protein ELH40_09830 [Rhizobium ruizarguesonis]|uniref:Uncharacterized protein n=1 Tax=Rhizobium ruizarguesonis TaxID=2081791 RepID=A0AB38I379_9HYPH|nr:hypothetical protein ELH40_09830 [Rhizobium ruizarguesonis]
MLAYGFQLVNAEQSEVNILGGMAEKRVISELWRTYGTIEPAAERRFAILPPCSRFFRQSVFSFATMGDVTRCVPESNASPRSG